jgi:hypothetical protein
LAYAELRLMIDVIYRRFDLALPDGFDRQAWRNSIKDGFIFRSSNLPVLMKDRAK